MSGESATEELRAAFDELIGALQRARDAVDSPDRHAPPPTDRGLAEGYRYLLGFLFGSIERAFFEDADFPYFRRAIQPVDKATIDNADALYLSAPIDGSGCYRLRGRLAPARKAPAYLIVEAHTAYAGDSGGLGELAPGQRAITGSLDSTAIQVDDDGRFEIMAGPERPAGWTGDFLPTRAETADGAHSARYLIVRYLFDDWAEEGSPELTITRIGNEGGHPPPLQPAAAAEKMRRLGALVENQMCFWNEFYDVLLEAHGDRNGDGQTFMPRNGLNEPARANLATGGGQNTNVYSGGTFDLAPDEALVVEVTVPVVPSYLGVHLANLWGESLDYANHVSSLNGFQAEPDEDGTLRFVVAHTDPGVPNWLDTTGLHRGFMTVRWTYPQPPQELPKVSVTTLAHRDIGRALPTGTRRISGEERRKQIAIRQEHVQRRYRQY
ncbi:MAG: hypothetical protein SW019_24280 [Actinomycetota bacterium]|nr:hypothetical protein [Actinomycetota bacterium]